MARSQGSKPHGKCERKMSFSTRQVKTFVAQAIEGIGGEPAWALLVPKLREAVVAERAMLILMGQMDGYTMTPRTLVDLLTAMRTEAGLTP